MEFLFGLNIGTALRRPKARRYSQNLPQYCGIFYSCGRRIIMDEKELSNQELETIIEENLSIFEESSIDMWPMLV